MVGCEGTESRQVQDCQSDAGQSAAAECGRPHRQLGGAGAARRLVRGGEVPGQSHGGAHPTQ